ncbi:MAG: pseudouridine synthase [Patescibacteria group bacterium]
MILQKFIAATGFCSRRKAKELIKMGKVKINNQIAQSGYAVKENDVVEIDNKKLELPKEKIYIKFNKPIDYVCTHGTFKGEKNIFELLPLKMNRLIIVGRLDKNSRGLIILTNDGLFAELLTHPRYENEKEYYVKIFNPSTVEWLNNKSAEIIQRFKRGINIGEGDGVVRAKNIEYLGDNNFKIILTEGKKRQIRRMFKIFGLEVKDLTRTRIGKWKLENLAEGKWEILNK